MTTDKPNTAITNRTVLERLALEGVAANEYYTFNDNLNITTDLQLIAIADLNEKPGELKKVNVGVFRDAVSHLERKFFQDRHACVGVKEKQHWLVCAQNILAELKGIQCARAKADLQARKESIISVVTAYIVEHADEHST